MNNKWKSDSCKAIDNYCVVYSVPMASAMWCGVPANQVSEVLKDAVPTVAFDVSHGVWSHPDIPDLKNTSRAITVAIDGGILPCCFKDGTVAKDIPYDQRHITRYHLKSWAENDLPNIQPAFLYGNNNQSTQLTTADQPPIIKQSEESPTDDELGSLDKNPYWKQFQRKTHKVVASYPEWKKSQRKIQKTGNLMDWLKGEHKLNDREAEIIKKVLSDSHNELR